MRRRELVKIIAGATAARPSLAAAQRSERVRRVGLLWNFAAGDPEGQARFTAFRDALQQLGWIDSRNLVIDNRWSTGEPDFSRKAAAEFARTHPDVVIASGS